MGGGVGQTDDVGWGGGQKSFWLDVLDG